MHIPYLRMFEVPFAEGVRVMNKINHMMRFGDAITLQFKMVFSLYTLTTGM
jgi:hypothetical protein